jgi:choline kinase
MKAIILAAGSGRRLRIHKPKGMLNIGGKPLIEYSIRNLQKAGVKDILVVTGFKSEIYEDHFMFRDDVNLIHNPEYANCGSLYTLYLALKHLRDTDDLVILDSDIIYNWDEFSEFMNSEYTNSVLATNVPDGRHDACYIQADLNDNLVKVSKNIHYITNREDDKHWEYIGITRTSRKSVNKIIDYAEQLFSQTGNLDHEYDYAFETIDEQYKILRYTDYVWSEADDNIQLEYMTTIVYPKITLV